MGIELKFIVYQTINIVNNKIYIGVHGTQDPEIFDGYIGNGVNINYPSTYKNPKYPFQYAVNKYGTSNFRRTTLYVFDNEEDAYNKEREIVNEDFILRSDTYNLALGGWHVRYSPHKKEVYQFDTDGLLIKRWDSVYQIAEFYNMWKQSIYSAINCKQRLYGYYWSYTENINITEYSNPNNSRKVYKYNKQGKCIAIYNTIGIAARENDTKPGHIIQRIKTGMFSENQFYYSYELYDTYIPKPRLDLKDKNVYLYDKDGNFVKEISVKDLKKQYNIHSYKEISNIIINKSLLQGFQIRLEYNEHIEKYAPKNKKKPVLIYTIGGEFVREFESVTQACKTLKLDSSTVCKILRGCAKSTKGYTIKYKI